MTDQPVVLSFSTSTLADTTISVLDKNQKVLYTIQTAPLPKEPKPTVATPPQPTTVSRHTSDGSKVIIADFEWKHPGYGSPTITRKDGGTKEEINEIFKQKNSPSK